jgi:hypothetical protein
LHVFEGEMMLLKNPKDPQCCGEYYVPPYMQFTAQVTRSVQDGIGGMRCFNAALSYGNAAFDTTDKGGFASISHSQHMLLVFVVVLTVFH